MNLGKKIELYAKHANISIRQLAMTTGINYNTLYAFVKRNGQKLPQEKIFKIAKALGVNEQCFLAGTYVEYTESDLTLQSTINDIVGECNSKQREDRLLIINDFLESNIDFIKQLITVLEK